MTGENKITLLYKYTFVFHCEHFKYNYIIMKYVSGNNWQNCQCLFFLFFVFCFCLRLTRQKQCHKWNGTKNAAECQDREPTLWFCFGMECSIDLFTLSLSPFPHTPSPIFILESCCCVLSLVICLSRINFYLSSTSPPYSSFLGFFVGVWRVSSWRQIRDERTAR